MMMMMSGNIPNYLISRADTDNTDDAAGDEEAWKLA